MWDRASITCWKFSEKKKCSLASTARFPNSNACHPERSEGPLTSSDNRASCACVIYHPARDPSSSARLRMTRELFLRLFRPRISERDRAIPHLFFTCGIRIEREVAETFKLITFFGTRARKRGFAFRLHHFQRIGINK